MGKLSDKKRSARRPGSTDRARRKSRPPSRTWIWAAGNVTGDGTGWEKYGRKHWARQMKHDLACPVAHLIGERTTPES